ncbi:MAG: hypothetical protein HXX13_14060 [Bacteroidetes bacterium]|nr:hypothetical protein [Bacteroidota bacterium]
MKQTYQITQSIKPIYIDKELLREIENYCFNQLPGYLEIEPQALRECYSISLLGSTGEQRIDGIDNYELSTLPEDIKKIIIRLYYQNNETDSLLSIQYSFGEERFSSNLTTEIFTENANEKALVINENILRILHQNKTLNYLFHPSQILLTLLIAICALIPCIAGYQWFNNKEAAKVILLIGIPAAGYYWIAQQLKPFCSFDTNRQKTNDKISYYFLLGTLGFIIISTIFTILKK